MKTHALLATATGLGLIVACGGSSSSSSPKSNDSATLPPADADAGADAAPPLDYGSVSTTYPAFTPEVGQIVNNGGAVLVSPVFTTISWTGDANADTFEQFGDALGPSAYWKTIMSEYGVGAGSSGDGHHIRLTTDKDPVPTTITDTQLQTFVASHLTDATSGWPAPTGQDVYIIYLPTTTSLTLQGQDACQSGVGGYHDSTTVNGKNVAFAIIPQCGGSAADESTLSASHEFAEASADPLKTDPAWIGFDDDHVAWELFQQFQSETGDACEFYRDSSLAANESDVGFVVQRQWSNKSGSKGHDPCVPSFANEIYFSTTPLNLEDVTMDLSEAGGDPDTATKGYTIKIGETKQIPVGFYSDAAMPAWTITASGGGIMGGGSSRSALTVTIDQATGQNGQKAYLSVTVNTQGKTKSELLTVVSSNQLSKHYMPILIATPDATSTTSATGN